MFTKRLFENYVILNFDILSYLLTTTQNGRDDVAPRRINEGRVCDAVIRILERRTRRKRRDLRTHADAGNGKNVEARFRLGSQEYAIETRASTRSTIKLGSSCCLRSSEGRSLPSCRVPFLDQAIGSFVCPAILVVALSEEASQEALIEWLTTAAARRPVPGMRASLRRR